MSNSNLSSGLKTVILFVYILGSQTLWSQRDSTFVKGGPVVPKTEIQSTKIYKTHPGWEIPVSIALIGSASLGYKEMDKAASLTSDQVLALNPETINAFDRPAAYYDPAGFSDAALKSDILMTAVVASPLLFAFDKKIRKDWADLLGMLLLAHAVDNTILFSAFLSVRRPRPVAYNPAAPMDEKTGVGKTNSFFSGHASWAMASTYFIVKVYTDYHQIKGLKRLLLYTVAAVPPAFVGYYRVHAGRHFESDAIVGMIIGGACGILIPELHRIKNKVPGLSMQPFFKLGSNGLSLSYIIK